MRSEFLRFSNDVISPTEDSADAVSFDLYSAKEFIRSSSSVRIIPTNIGFNIPKGCFCKTHSSSSLAMQFTDIGWAVIDVDSRDPLSAVFFNFSNRYFEVKKGQRFAQIIF